MTAGLKCRKCKSAHTVDQLLSTSTKCWPNQGWIEFVCTACGQTAKLAPEAGKLTIGDIDGAPGPAFFPDEELAVPDLKYEKKYGGLQVKVGGKSYSFSSRGRAKVKRKPLSK